MKIALHTPKGILVIDTETVTDKQLKALKITRQALVELTPRDLAHELDILRERVTLIEEGKVSAI